MYSEKFKSSLADASQLIGNRELNSPNHNPEPKLKNNPNPNPKGQRSACVRQTALTFLYTNAVVMAPHITCKS